LRKVRAAPFFETLLQGTRYGFFADPIFGGNRDMAAWKMIGFPGARYDYRDWVERHNERYPIRRSALPDAMHGPHHNHESGLERAICRSSWPQPVRPRAGRRPLGRGPADPAQPQYCGDCFLGRAGVRVRAAQFRSVRVRRRWTPR
jgi:hypothetical protein